MNIFINNFQKKLFSNIVLFFFIIIKSIFYPPIFIQNLKWWKASFTFSNKWRRKKNISNLNKDSIWFYVDKTQEIKIKLNVAERGIEETQKLEDSISLRKENDF